MTDLGPFTLDERREAINQAIPSKRDREILYMRLLDGYCYKEIAAEMHISVRQVGNILAKGCAKVGRYLETHCR